MPDTILEEDHPRIISAKLPCNFEVILITHLGVLALFSSILKKN
jgi:hypothetical protein